jgi:hypothetical protein
MSEKSESWVVRVEDREKGGDATVTALGPKVTDEVSHRAVAQVELLGDLRERPPLDKEGSENLVASMEKLVGFAKELLAEQVVVHDVTSENCHRVISRNEGNRNGVGGAKTRPSRGFGISSPEKPRRNAWSSGGPGREEIIGSV